VSGLHFSEAQVREILKDQGESTSSSSGDQVERREVRAGAPTSWKAAGRLEGRSIVFLHQGREQRLQVGVKSPAELVFGMMGVPSGVYRKR
jgi:hypothetical protein